MLRFQGRTRRLLATLMSALMCALLPLGAARAADTLRVGGKNFTEQYVLAQITADYLRQKGYSVDVRAGLGSTLMRSAQENGQLDIVWEYTGTAALVYNKIPDAVKLDPQALYEKVREADAPHGLVWLDPARLNNTYALGVPQQIAREWDVKTISQLVEKLRADNGRKHIFAMDAEFANRADGLRPLQALYGMKFDRSELKQMDPGLVYTALHNNQVTVGLIYTTDGRVRGFNIVALEDDRHYFPNYNATPVVRREVLDRHPDLARHLNALAAVLDNDVMLDMNKQVDIDGRSVRDVAADFLRTHKLP
ncbi:glycine/betaine ABC transporter substrate-binding protein [Bordetella genomosp. 9]|uniref:glycine betaine ABC transporter substrate-binding protein n=1 Tax=Bordetella genomosp. 9 TaxID=1416803 RepID=UPI000A28EBD6|nr:glycine/betaine ABC transporter substrate-binding protein [Bordetella genomosp. 9]